MVTLIINMSSSSISSIQYSARMLTKHTTVKAVTLFKTPETKKNQQLNLNFLFIHLFSVFLMSELTNAHNTWTLHHRRRILSEEKCLDMTWSLLVAASECKMSRSVR